MNYLKVKREYFSFSLSNIGRRKHKIVHLVFISHKSKTKHRINLGLLLYRVILDVWPEHGFSLLFPSPVFCFSVTRYQSLQHLSLFLPLSTSLDPSSQRILLTHIEKKPETSIVAIIPSYFLPKRFKDRKSWLCYATIKYKQKMKGVNEIIKNIHRDKKLSIFFFLKLIQSAGL